MKFTGIITCLLLIMACHRPEEIPGQLEIGWDEGPEGDYAFAGAWDYPEGVYRNEHGQLSCDGFCPPETEAMKDSTGRIYGDSLSAFYALVDTAHRFHSMQAEVQCDEYAGTDYAIAQRQRDTVFCYSLCNAATHCSLQLRLYGNYCEASVELRSIASGGNTSYKLHSGTIKIARKAWQADSLKAAFDLDFGRDSLSGKPVSWKGKIYTPIYKE